MSPIPRRDLLAGSALGITSLVLPAASAAATGDDSPSPSVAFAPVVEFENAGGLPDTRVTVRMAWASGYTYASFGSRPLTGTTGDLAAFSYTVTGTDTDDQPITSSGSSDGSLVSVNQSAKIGAIVTVTLTSDQFPSDVRTFPYTRN